MSNEQRATSNEQRATSKPLSEKWLKKFDLLEKIGADKLPLSQARKSTEFKSLSFWQKFKINNNILAFFFTCWYYFVKGMYLKGFLILGGSCALTATLTFLESSGWGGNAALYWLPVSAFSSLHANHDYYKHVKNKEKVWSWAPTFLSRTSVAAVFSVVMLMLSLSALTLTPEYDKGVDDQFLADVSGVWRGNSDGAMVSVYFMNDKKHIDINGKVIPVKLKDIDQENDNVVFEVDLNEGGSVLWTIRKKLESDGRFNLHMTLHDGTEDGLSFVRRL